MVAGVFRGRKIPTRKCTCRGRFGGGRNLHNFFNTEPFSKIFAPIESSHRPLSNAAKFIENGCIHATLWTSFERVKNHIKIPNDGNIRHWEFRIQKQNGLSAHHVESARSSCPFGKRKEVLFNCTRLGWSPQAASRKRRPSRTHLLEVRVGNLQSRALPPKATGSASWSQGSERPTDEP